MAISTKAELIRLYNDFIVDLNPDDQYATPKFFIEIICTRIAEYKIDYAALLVDILKQEG